MACYNLNVLLQGQSVKETKRYWGMKREALDRTVWRTRFGRIYGPVLGQTAEVMNVGI